MMVARPSFFTSPGDFKALMQSAAYKIALLHAGTARTWPLAAPSLQKRAGAGPRTKTWKGNGIRGGADVLDCGAEFFPNLRPSRPAWTRFVAESSQGAPSAATPAPSGRVSLPGIIIKKSAPPTRAPARAGDIFRGVTAVGVDQDHESRRATSVYF